MGLCAYRSSLLGVLGYGPTIISEASHRQGKSLQRRFCLRALRALYTDNKFRHAIDVSQPQARAHNYLSAFFDLSKRNPLSVGNLLALLGDALAYGRYAMRLAEASANIKGIEMKSMFFKPESGTALLALLGIFGAAIGVGCGPNKTREDAGTSPQAATNRLTTTTNAGSLPHNRALRLDGKTASMSVPDSPSMHSLTNAITLELWFKAASFYRQSGAVNSLLRKNVEAGGENFFLRFRIMMGKPTVEISCASRILQAPYDFETNTWYHLAGTCDGNMMRAFVNGEEVGSQRFTGPITIDDSGLMIGKGDPKYSMGEYFQGDLGEIRIWNVARSPGDLQAAMKKRLTGKEPGLVAYWTFDDGTARDFSTNGNNGVLDGEAQIVGVSSFDSAQPDSSQKR